MGGDRIVKATKLSDNVFWVGAVDWDRRLFDSLIPIPEGTTYNAYLVKGDEKTALIDTVDPAMTSVLLSRLDDLGVVDLDYVIANHAEQDHSGSLPHVIARFPRAKIVATPKAKKMLVDLLSVEEGRIIAVEDGEKLSLGGRTLEFIHFPWVHWPETMTTYLQEERILFSCDFFGAHLATSGLYCDDESKLCTEVKRYYAGIMMPFRTIIRRHLERIDKYSIAMIAPSHGPVNRDPTCILQSHRDWVSDTVANKVVLPYVSMHGSTQAMVDYLTESLSEKGIAVERFNLTVADLGSLGMALIDAATIVIGSPTILAGAHPQIISAAFLANALRPKLKFASIVGSYGWGGKTVEQITGMLSNLKVEMLDPVLVVGHPKEDAFTALEKLASTILAKHKELNIA